MNAALRRRVIYIAGIVLLLLPLIRLSAPATYQNNEQKPGGVLSQLRYEHELSQANLGSIDPASEAMRLATLGLRGVAANILWSKAFHYKKVEDYDALRATLNQITALQPNFITVWEFQAHNLSYNISVEFDDFRSRYHWVKKGVEFLLAGTQFNRDEPRLLSTIGWYLSQKIGRADEKVAFRRLFRDDTEFHRTLDRPYIEVDSPEAKHDGKPDNWLVGRLWFAESQRVVDTKGQPLRGKSPLIFHSHAPMCLINFSTAIENEGYFDEVARRAWRRADESWTRFGDRQIPTSWGVNIRLNDLDQVSSEVQQLEERLERLAPGLKEEIRQEKMAQLTSAERAALAKPEEQRTQEEYMAGAEAEAKTDVPYREVAARAPEGVRGEARLLARELEEKLEHRRRIHRYRGIVNFDYWKTRCEVEQTEAATNARRYVYEADELWKKASFDAKDRYEQAWIEWAKIMNAHPVMLEDVTAENLVDAIKQYRIVIEQLGESWPPQDFPLTELLRVRALKFGDTSLGDFTDAPAEPATTPVNPVQSADVPTAGPAPQPAPSQPGAPAETEPAPATPNPETPQPTAPGQPADGKPADGKPADEKPADEKPADGKPAEEKPAEEKPAEEKPAEEKPAEEKPAEEKPAEEKPAEEKPAEEKPAAEKPAEEKPAEEKPAEGKPAADGSGG